MKTTKKFLIGIAILIALSPMGLILPDLFKAGSAWGEWGVDEIQQMTGYAPSGLSKLSNLWNAPMPDYAFKTSEEKGLAHLSFAYIFSAILGVIVIIILTTFAGKLLSRKET